MELRKSKHRKGWIGLFIEDENNYPEEVVSMPKKNAIEFVNKCQKFIKSFGG